MAAPRIILNTLRILLCMLLSPLPTIFVLRALKLHDFLESTQPDTARFFLLLYSFAALGVFGVTFMVLVGMSGAEGGGGGGGRRRSGGGAAKEKVMAVNGGGSHGSPGQSKRIWVSRTEILELIYANVRNLPSDKKEEYRRFIIGQLEEVDLEGLRREDRVGDVRGPPEERKKDI